MIEAPETARAAFVAAARALERLDGHEKTCGERWEASRRDMRRVEDAVDGLSKAVQESNNITRNGFDALRTDISAKNKAVYERIEADRRLVNSRFWWFAGLVIGGQSAAIFALVAWALSKIAIGGS